MKKLITILLLFSCSVSFGQQKTETKYYTYEGQRYTLKYVYDGKVFNLRQEGTHRVVYYPAQIIVFNGLERVAEITGVYSPDFNKNDDPEKWVKTALDKNKNSIH